MTRYRVTKSGELEPVKHRSSLYFREFETAQMTEADAREVGAHYDRKDGVTTVRSEASLRKYLYLERSRGRDVRWREH
jgi:hypothetical protein